MNGSCFLFLVRRTWFLNALLRVLPDSHSCVQELQVKRSVKKECGGTPHMNCMSTRCCQYTRTHTHTHTTRTRTRTDTHHTHTPHAHAHTHTHTHRHTPHAHTTRTHAHTHQRRHTLRQGDTEREGELKD